MKPLYLQCQGGHTVAAIYQPATAAPNGTGVLIVPPFGWDEQTSYRPRRDWSLALAQCGFANLRIDLPGTGDSSGSADDDGLVDAWTAAVARSLDSLREAGAERVAVVALGAGGLVTLQAIARGADVDDLVLWGVPATGRSLVREVKAFCRLEQSQTGELDDARPEGELRAGGHVLAPATIAALSSLDCRQLLESEGPARALVLGRDGMGPDPTLVEALRASGADVRTDPGRGWGAALARPQSASPFAMFEVVNAWLAETAQTGAGLTDPAGSDTADFGRDGARFRETQIIFNGAGQQLYGVLSVPVAAPTAEHTMILFNAGAIRRIGPNRMWTEAARRWAAMGVPVLRVDVEGIGDASGDGGKYLDTDDTFYTEDLVAQAHAALDLAAERGLPERFVLGGLCSGAFWAFQIAVEDPRVSDVIALNPRLLVFQENAEGGRDLRKLGRMATPRGFRNLLREKQKLRRFSRLAAFALQTPLRATNGAGRSAKDELAQALRTLQSRGQRLHVAFSDDEPLASELGGGPSAAAVGQFGVIFHGLPYRSHTLKPLGAQQAAHALIDEVVGEACLPRSQKRCAG
ncbi:pimeloyl-ACP methyl ester carboxylesterase [Sphingomonas sp. F9_3S_D5_B_2]